MDDPPAHLRRGWAVWPAATLTVVAVVCAFLFLYAWFIALPAGIAAVAFGVVGLRSGENWRRALCGSSVAMSGLVVALAGLVLVFYLAGFATVV